MPDFTMLAKGVLTAGAVAGALLLAWAARKGTIRAAFVWAASTGVGLFVGYVALREWPRWPPREDRDRLLLVLLPLALAGEVVAAALPGKWLRWIPRLSVAAAAAPILLYETVYWASPAQGALLVISLATLLALVWVLLQALDDISPPHTVSPLLIPVLLAAALAVMLSGYIRGGTLALPIAGALAGTALAAAALPRQPETGPALGLGVVGLAATLLLGRFFGSLPTSFALALLFAPLVGWLAILPGLRQQSVSVRVLLPLAALLVILAGVLTCAWVRFQTAFGAGPG